MARARPATVTLIRSKPVQPDMLLRHSGLYLLARGLPGVVSLGAIAIYTRLLSPDEYGLYALVGAVVGLVSVFLFQWLRSGLLRFRLVYAERRGDFLSTLFLAQGVIAVSTGLIGAAAVWLIQDPTVRLLVPFGVALLWATSLYSLQLELARSELAPHRYGLMALASGVLSLAFATALIYAGFGVLGLLAGSVLGTLVPLAFTLPTQLRIVRPRLADPAIARQLLLYGAPLTFTFVLEFVVNSSDRLLIGWLLDEDAVGRYAVAYDLGAHPISLIAAIINLAAYPLAVRALELGGPAQARRQLEHNFVLLFGMGLPATAGMILMAPNIAGVLLGEAFRASAPPIMSVVALAVLIARMKAFYTDLSFQLGRRTAYQMRVSGAAAVVNVVLNLWWIPRFGLLGAAWATLAAYIVGLALSVYWGRQVFRLPFPAVDAIKIALATAIMALFLWPLLDHVGAFWVALQVGIGAAVYAVMLWLLDVAGLRARAGRLLMAQVRGRRKIDLRTAPRTRFQAQAAAPAPLQPGDRIALYAPSLRGGGAERVMLNLARAMADKGFLVDLVLVKAEGPYLGDVPSHVNVVDLNAGRVLRSLPGLVRYLLRAQPAGLISAQSHANLIAIWARALARSPTAVVVSEHSSPPPAAGSRARKIQSSIFNALLHRFYAGVAVVAVSEGVARHVAATARIAPTRISVIYNPIVAPELADCAREEVGHPWFAPGAPPVILSVGRLTPAKDFSTLLKAFAQVSRTRDARLMILGEGEERAQLEALVRALDVAEHVCLPGFVGNPFAYMARCGVFVLSSRWEGLPSALIEALACGCPLVSTDCKSGPREILQDGRWGRLVPVGDIIALAEALIDVLDHPPPPPEPDALVRFGPEGAADAYLALLEAHRRA